MAGCVSTGPGGGFVVRTLVPGMYEGPPHMHLEVSLPHRGRFVWHVNFRPDSATRVLPNSRNLGAAMGMEDYADEHFALVHLDPDGVYRTRRPRLAPRGGRAAVRTRTVARGRARGAVARRGYFVTTTDLLATPPGARRIPK
jgi:hypothetical protein